jgi:DNA repair exonuclease SbcCD ATPase subunit
VIIEEIKVQGFSCYEKEVSFVLEPETVYLVTGRNGAGKSSLFADSLSFLFFNTLTKNTSIDNAINDKSKKCSVTIREKGGNTISREREFGRTALYRNDKTISQDELNGIVGTDKELFFNSVVFSQGFGGFTYFENKEKKEFITKISLSFIDDYLLRLKGLADGYSSELVAAVSEVDGIQNKIEGLNIAELQTNFYNFDVQRKSKLDGLNIQMEQIRSQITTQTSSRGTAEKELEEVGKTLDALELDLVDLEKKLEQKNDKKNTYLRQKEVFVSHAERIRKQIHDLEDAEGDCPFCLTPITQQVSASGVAKLDAEMKKYQKDHANLSGLLHKVEEELSELCSMSHEKNKQNEKLLLVERDKQNRIGSIDLTLSKLKSEMASATRERDRLNSEENPYKKMLAASEGTRDELYKRKELAFAKKTDLEKKISACAFLNEGIRKFKSEMFASLLSAFEPLANDNLRFISDGRFFININVDLRITKARITDKFDMVVLDNGNPASFSRLSDGEKRQIALAVNMALIQLLSLHFAQEWNFIVFDEIFSDLDDYAKTKVIDLVDRLRRNTHKTIIIITHDTFEVKSEGFVEIAIESGKG